MKDFLVWLPVVVSVVGILLVLKFLVRKIGCNCHKCGGRMAFWDEFEESERQDILTYFRQYEKRDVNTSSTPLSAAPCPGRKREGKE